MQPTQTQGQENNNGNNVTLDLRVSCNTFWKYEMKLSIDRNDFVEPNENDIVNGGGGAAGGDCFNSNKKVGAILGTPGPGPGGLPNDGGGSFWSATPSTGGHRLWTRSSSF